MSLSMSPRDVGVQAQLALVLRVGLGVMFIIGGIAKLARLLSVSRAQGIVDEYVGPLGYINQTFLDWMFSGQLPAFVTPWSFLTVLSAFELVSGMMLVVDGGRLFAFDKAWAALREGLGIYLLRRP